MWVAAAFSIVMSALNVLAPPDGRSGLFAAGWAMVAAIAVVAGFRKPRVGGLRTDRATA